MKCIKKRYIIGTFLIGIGVGITLGVLLQLYWFYLVIVCIVSGVILIR